MYKKIQNINSGHQGNSVLIIYTGGTMGMTFDPTGKFLIPFDFDGMLEKIPELKRLNTGLSFIAADKPIDSANVNPSHWIDLATLIYEHYDAYTGFVVLHGTDTMAYTASALSFLLEHFDKPVIFTGAQLPLEVVRTDARENLITAIEIASAKRQDGSSLVQEVCIYFDYALLRANRSKKVQTSQFDAFLSENYPPLAEAGVSIEYQGDLLFKPEKKDIKLYKKLESQVFLLKLFPGIPVSYLEKVFALPDLKGIVLETYGMGNAPTHPEFVKILRQVIQKGVPVLNISQCLGGTVYQGKYQTSKHLEQEGVLSGADMTTEAAITKMMFVLANKPYSQQVKESLTKSLRGELG